MGVSDWTNGHHYDDDYYDGFMTHKKPKAPFVQFQKCYLWQSVLQVTGYLVDKWENNKYLNPPVLLAMSRAAGKL